MPYTAAVPQIQKGKENVDHDHKSESNQETPVDLKNQSKQVTPEQRRKMSVLIGDENSMTLAFLHKPARSNSGSDTREYRKLMEENTRRNKLQSRENTQDEDTNSMSTLLSPLITTDTDSLQRSSSTISVPLVRKKSGEFVKSSLKSHSRAASLPSTPSYKQVHFGESSGPAVKYFDERDTPRTISGNNSPKDWERRPRDYFSLHGDVKDLYSEYNESAISDDEENDLSQSKESLISNESYNTRLLLNGEWKLTLSNFPDLSYPKKIKEDAKVFLERIFLSENKENLCGQIAVKNLSFSKNVVVRYSADGWRSITEIDSRFVATSTAKLRRNKYDRFEFEVPLVTLFHNTQEETHNGYTDVFSKFSLCVRYQVDGQEYWDNNGSDNFNVVLHKITSHALHGHHKGDTHYPKTQKHSSKYLTKKKSETDLATKNMNSQEIDQRRIEEYANDQKDSETISQSILDRYLDATQYPPNSPETPRMTNTPYSPIELNPQNKDQDHRFDSIDNLDITYPSTEDTDQLSSQMRAGSESPKSPVQAQLGDIDTALEPPKFNYTNRPPVSSAKYQEILDKFCFFGGESSSSTATVSSVLGKKR